METPARRAMSVELGRREAVLSERRQRARLRGFRRGVRSLRLRHLGASSAIPTPVTGLGGHLVVGGRRSVNPEAGVARRGPLGYRRRPAFSPQKDRHARPCHRVRRFRIHRIADRAGLWPSERLAHPRRRAPAVAGLPATNARRRRPDRDRPGQYPRSPRRCERAHGCAPGGGGVCAIGTPFESGASEFRGDPRRGSEDRRRGRAAPRDRQLRLRFRDRRRARLVIEGGARARRRARPPCGPRSWGGHPAAVGGVRSRKTPSSARWPPWPSPVRSCRCSVR